MERIDQDGIVILQSGQAPYFSADGQYPHIPNKNFYYFTGLERENFALVLIQKQGKVSERLYIEKPNPDIEKWTGIKMRKEEAVEISGITDVRFVEVLEREINQLLHGGEVNQIWLDLERQGWNTPDTPEMGFAAELKRRYPFVQINTLQAHVSALRVIKHAPEISELREAIRETKCGFEELMTDLEPGKMEYQMAARFEFAAKYQGAQGLGFPTITAGGKNAVILHYVENDQELQDGDLLLLDFGALHGNYSADISRTVPVNGVYTDRQKQLYNIVLKAEMAVIEAVKPGLAFAELNKIASKVLAEELKAIGLIEKDEDLSKYYYHGVSHYLGMDTHDIGSRETELKPGMVITVEPGLYVAEEGIGIRIEDDILVTVDGAENLSADIPKTVEEIEAFMAKA